LKGIIFNLLEEVVTQQRGATAWDDLLLEAKLEGAYSGLANYPDNELTRLVGSASKQFTMPPDDVVRWFGSEAMPLLAERYPEFFKGHDSASTFLLTLNDIIHAEVRKLHPDAELPYFEMKVPEPGVVSLVYASPRRLCSLAEGFIKGAASHFDEVLQFDQPRCMKRGDDTCLLICSFSKLP